MPNPAPQVPGGLPMGATPPQGGSPVTIDAVVQLLRDDRMRGFRIDVETDSMVEADQIKEKQAANELVTALGGFFKEFGPVVQAMPPLAPMVSELLVFALRRYKVGAQLEEVVEKSMNEVVQHLQNPAPPQPDPSEQAKTEQAQIKAKAEAEKAQLEGQIAVTKAQAETAKAELDAHHATKDDERKAALHEMEIAAKKIAHDHDMSARQLEMDRAEQIHNLTIDKMRHEADIKSQSAEHEVGLKIKSAEHDHALKKDATSHDMSLKEKQAKGGEDKKASTENKAKLEKLFADIAKAITSKKKIVRDGKGEIVGIESSDKD